MNPNTPEKTKLGKSCWLTLAIDFGKTFGLRRMVRKGVYVMTHNIATCPNEETQITTKNCYKMFLLPYDKGISKELKVFKIHEPLATKILMNELKDGMTVVDIGSNIGYYAILESKIVGKRGKVIAIEPIKRNFQCLLKNMEINHLSNVTAINVAFSNKKGMLRMGNGNCSNKSHVLGDESQTMLNVEEVPAVRGDELLKSITNIDLLRLDVEGYEDLILEGCYETIQKFSPDILVEIHIPLLGNERFQNLISKFRKWKYTIKYIVPRTVDFPIVANDRDFATKHINEPSSKLFFNSTAWSYFTIFISSASKN